MRPRLLWGTGAPRVARLTAATVRWLAPRQHGDEILALPGGFQNVTFSKIGEIMSDGTPVPVAHDGMAAFKGHGDNFLVRTSARGPEKSPPLTAMGRFAHEACATDPRAGIVYQTEDDGNDNGYYRFRPRDPRDLPRGGRLEMLAIKGEPARSMITGQEIGGPLRVDSREQASVSVGGRGAFPQVRLGLRGSTPMS